MAWPPGQFFLGQPGEIEDRPQRPLGQGDVFQEVPFPRKFVEGKQPSFSAPNRNVIVVASSCGMRKGPGGQLGPLIHAAPISAKDSLAKNWEEPLDPNRFLHCMPLPGLGEELLLADLGRTSLCPAEYLTPDNRIGCLTLDGMAALKGRLSAYFTRTRLEPEIFQPGAHEEWHELDLWETWTQRKNTDEGFQGWLDEENPNTEGSSRRETAVADLEGIKEQLDAATS